MQHAASYELAEIVEAQAALMRQVELSAALQRQRTYLSGFPQSEVAAVLIQAQDSWDAEIYEQACRELARLDGLRKTYETRLGLLARLENSAPAWTHAIVRRHKPHTASQLPGESVTAWRWRQWCQELDRRAAVSIPELQGQLDKAEDELRRLAAQIIEHETWATQLERPDRLAKQLALQGFVKVVAKITKSRKGKRDAELLREARHLLSLARTAVPVWIMPLSRVYESFDPCETRFDVVIIDEASQRDVTALAALYRGREHVVVGDDKQVTSDAVAQRLDEVQRLIDTELQEIPNRIR